MSIDPFLSRYPRVTGEGEPQHVDEHLAKSPDVHFGEVISQRHGASVVLLRRHELRSTREPATEQFGRWKAFELFEVQRSRIAEIDDLCVGQIVIQHHVPWLQVSVDNAGLVHVSYG